ncbi:NAD(P)H-quinone oxidoreductase [Polyangium aurulentum]|uniref:NAD(P)H-quinone oxidoreductase n=1 Tax=Polyangium aurulentum TaxID=2567896 RepID=UPI00200DFAD3|nr:NAD(P)H-quinone oxidoreductase [Polyangium aurulentum]UQA57656.1 NAD(P)H-quinone oxidoreductase [Polyangium aurulentum]
MRAIVIRSPGGPEVLELCDIPEPDPPYGHVRVRVQAAGVNRADLMQRAGHYPAPPGVPSDIPGLEYAGTVDAVGPGVARFSGGERVYGLVAGGAYAEKIVVHERETVAVPEGLSDEEAASVPEAFLTALDALLVRGHLAPGERVLVHAAGSGVGTAGIQIARALGCLVIGTSRTEDKLERCRSLGMDAGVVAEGGKFADKVIALSKGGVDVVLDLVGGAYLADTIASCAPRARIVAVGLTAGARAELDLGAVLRKRLEIVGTVMRARPLEEKIEAARLLDKTLGPWIARGVVKPVIDRVFALGDARDAHTYVASNASFGKVLLDARR